MANKIYDSPGVYMSEKDLTFSTEVIGVTTLGLVGETLKGPAMQPIFIKNYDDFKVMFGATSPAKYKNTQIPKYELAYIAKSYLSQTNQLYVTRVLGLSGYNAGWAYVLRTTGKVDESTLSDTSTMNNTIPFHVTGSTFVYTTTGGDLIDQIAAVAGVATTEFDTAFNTYFRTTSLPAPYEGTTVSNPLGGDLKIGTITNSYSSTNGVYWGTLPTAVDAAFASVTTGGTQTDAYELPSDVSASYEEEHWLLNTFTLNVIATGDTYSGKAFAFYVDPNSISAPSGLTQGTVTVYVSDYTATPIEEYHNKEIATLRSRGFYTSNVINWWATSAAVLTETTAVDLDPYASFHITGTTLSALSGVTYDYTVNLDDSSNNYIKKVLGSSNTDKDAYLYVEDFYPTILREGYNKGYIKGVHPTIKVLNTWNHYGFQYQTPMTPFFVSELRGGEAQKLFRLISISDGNSANTEIKVSIANVDLDTKTFDVYIRRFTDVDRNPVLVERFLGCTMNPTSDEFIGKKIGTVDNMFDLKSSYVMVDLHEFAPTTAVPAGFEGFSYRTDTAVGVPQVAYKLKYYAAGETKYTTPFSTTTVSNGDKVKKVYLGFSDTVGIDPDLTQFKGFDGSGSAQWGVGSEWAGLTKGFHMDINAASIVNSDGDPVFEVGAGQFTDAVALAANATQTYYDPRSRKFTCVLTGGFDGWDIFRNSRTNTDTYKIGRTGFVTETRTGYKFETFNIQGKDEDYGTSDYYAYQVGGQSQENPEDVNINIFATPGIDLINNTDLIRDNLEIIEEKRMDSVYLPTLPDIKLLNNTSPANTDDWYYPTDIVSELEGTDIDSNYAAVFYPWEQIYDADNSTNLFIPPTTDVVRNLALTDNIAHPWYATAGYKRGLVNAKRTRIKLTQEYRDTLYKGRINPLATFTDIGIAIWGNRNLQVANSALNRLNIRRLLLQTKKLIGQVGNKLLFDPNDDTIRADFLSAVNPILDNIRKERGLVDFRVKLEQQADGDDRNTLRGKIFLKPTPALEVIDLEFTVTPTNVSFDSF